MSKQGAERAVVISALVVFGIYFYRHLTEGTAKTTTSSNCPSSVTGQGSGGSVSGVGQLIGFGTPANVGKFITAWGFVFFVLSIVTEAAPGLGGAFAILAATGDILANTCQVTHDIGTKLSTTSTNTPTASSTNGPVTGTVSAA